MTELDGLLHVVFGATGAIGGAVVTELVHAGRDVRAVSRGGQAPHGAQGVAADASDPVQAARAAVGASVIYHCASPSYTQWPELFPALTGSILSAAESSGAKLVYADNLYAYGPVNGPLREDLPAAARGRKGRTRVEMAAQLLAAHRNGLARVVIGRASDYYGPRGTGSTAGQTVFGPTFRVMKQRGKLLSSKLAPRVVATVHPSSLLRQPDEVSREREYKRFVADLRVAVKAANAE